MKTRVHVWVSGDVQGVFFRSNVRSQALLRKIRGWIRNLPDGRVEAVFEGNRGSVEEILNFCREGPAGARVVNVDVKWENPTGSFRDFEIKY